MGIAPTLDKRKDDMMVATSDSSGNSMAGLLDRIAAAAMDSSLAAMKDARKVGVMADAMDDSLDHEMVGSMDQVPVAAMVDESADQMVDTMVVYLVGWMVEKMASSTVAEKDARMATR
jgi:hypothetical protein